jgi:ribulose-phosphate 3-epimerase
MVEIIPSILATTKEEFVGMLQKLEPHTTRVHLDILDGALTPGKTILGYEELQNLETNLNFDVHLMVVHPAEYLPQWFKTKADRIFIHAEAQGNLSDMILEIKSQGRKAGIVLNPETPVDSIIECLPVVDYVQFMTVHPGSYGRPFLTDVVDKILNFHDIHPDVPIVVDGGMNPQTARLVFGAGAQIIISGSYIMNSPDIGKAIAEIQGDFK